MRSGFPISVNWTFFARCYGFGCTSEYRLKITGASWPRISGRRDRPHQPFFFSEKYAEWSFVRYRNLDRSFFRFVTIYAFDEQTDRRTDGQTYSVLIARARLHSMRRGKNSGERVAEWLTSLGSKQEIAGSNSGCRRKCWWLMELFVNTCIDEFILCLVCTALIQ